jgi:hypothetical protein
MNIGLITGILGKLASPVVGSVIATIVKAVLKSEFKFGKGKGVKKLAEVVAYIKAAIKKEHKITVDTKEITGLINAVVAMLNDLGLLSDDGVQWNFVVVLEHFSKIVDAVHDIVND